MMEVIKDEHCSLTVFHDHFNRRVRIDDYRGNIQSVIEYGLRIARQHKAEKLIFKVRREHASAFLENGFLLEGKIEGYFLGSDCLFFSRFLTPGRKTSSSWVEEDEMIDKVAILKRNVKAAIPPVDYQLKKLGGQDSVQLAALYDKVFSIYPTPMNDPEYIKKTIQEGTIYFGFDYKGEIVSASSAEINSFYQNAELTDCATLKEHRQYGLMKLLLLQLEKELKDMGIFCSYSLARALSFGMNAALHQLGYSYRGRLANNCLIFDKMEDMNIWCRNLAEDTEE
ncbi:putative beta-lysine N-acetyltransferase [Mesobacillus campisalis]|nr:putative beta-lysine N-acetyltransferase [Mesobacillus campisalis]